MIKHMPFILALRSVARSPAVGISTPGPTRVGACRTEVEPQAE